jgi:hypothetical protein
VLIGLVLIALTGGEGVYPDIPYKSEGWHIQCDRTSFAIDGGDERLGSVKLYVDLHAYKGQWFCVEMKRLSGPEYRWMHIVYMEGWMFQTAWYGPEVQCWQMRTDRYIKWIHVVGQGTGRAVYRPVFSIQEQPIQ